MTKWIICVIIGYIIGYYVRRNENNNIQENELPDSPYTIDYYYEQKVNRYCYRVLKNKLVDRYDSISYTYWDDVDDIQDFINHREEIEGYKITTWSY